MNLVYLIMTATDKAAAVDGAARSSTGGLDSHLILIAWIVIMLGALILDMVKPKPVSLWYSVGAFVAIIAKLLGVGFGWQLVIFTISSFIALMVISYRINVKSGVKMGAAAISDEMKSRFQIDHIIGMVGIVIKSIDPQDREMGLVKVGGVILPAKSLRGHEIKAGTKVIVKAIKTQELGGIAQFFGGINSMKYILLVVPLDNFVRTTGGDDGSRAG